MRRRRANRCLEDILNRNVYAVQFAGRDGAAIEHEARNVEPAQRHDDAGHILVAAADATSPSKRLPRAISSMESAITSRETREAFMPCVPW